MNGRVNKSGENSIVNDKLFGLLVESVKDYAIFMIDPDGKIMTWNKGAQRIKGYAASEVIGQHISIFYTDEDREKLEPQKNLAEALRIGRHEREGWRVRKSGERFWANIIFTPLYDEHGQLLGFAKITRDITKQKEDEEKELEWRLHLEKRIRENTQTITAYKRRFRKLIENSYDGISLFDEGFRIIYRSLSAKKITGLSDHERSSQQLTDIVYQEDKALFKDALARAMAQPAEPVFVTFRITRPDGCLTWLDCIFNNMLDNTDVNAIVCNFRDITEKKKDEEIIVKSSRQIQTILDRITDGFITLDINFNYIYANRKICEMTGMDAASLLGKNVWDVFPDAVGSKTYYAFKEAFERQQYVFNEDYFSPFDLWQENSIYPSPEGLSVFIRDISDRKKAENSLLQSVERLEQAAAVQNAILNALPPNIALLDGDSRIVAVNESWKKFAVANNFKLPGYGIGESYSAICEKAMKTGIHDAGEIAAGIKQVITGEKNEFSMEYPCDSPTEKRWFQLVAAPLNDLSQRGAVVLHIDITSRKLAEEKLLHSESNLRTVFENTDLSIVLFDNDLNIISFNSNAYRQSIRNFERKLKGGGHAYDYFPAARWPVIDGIVADVRNNKTVTYETEYNVKKGGKEWFDVRWVGISDRKNQNVGIILTLKNITEKKIADMEREKITADLIQRNKDLEQFTYIVSHNLRAPVANIKGLADLLTIADFQDNDAQETVEALGLSVGKLDNVIIDLNNILQTANRVNEKVELVSLPGLVEEVCAGLKPVIIQNKVIIQSDFRNIGQIFTVKSYLYSIFHNMITNSIKYRQQKFDPVILIQTALKGEYIEITFRDNGKGIDLQRYGQHIFGLYKRFDLSVDGKGMGLFMVKTQVESLGGNISVVSEVGKGTTFMILLPL